MHYLFLSVTEQPGIFGLHADIGLVDVLYPVREENIGYNKEIELRNKLPFLWCVVILKPADVIPLAVIACLRHCGESSRRSSLLMSIACTSATLCMSTFVYLVPAQASSNVDFVACAQVMQARDSSLTVFVLSSDRVASTTAWLPHGAIPSTSGVKA